MCDYELKTSCTCHNFFHGPEKPKVTPNTVFNSVLLYRLPPFPQPFQPVNAGAMWMMELRTAEKLISRGEYGS